MWWGTLAFLLLFFALEYILGVFTFFLKKANRLMYLKHMVERHLSSKLWRVAQFYVDFGVKKYPQVHYFQYMSGLVHYRKGDYSLSLSHFERAKKIAPDYTEIDNIIGDTYLQLQLFADAKKHLDRFLLSNPENVNARLNLAVAEYKTANWEGAIRILDQVIMLDANQPLAYKLKGSTLTKLKRDRDALESFKMYCQFGGSDPNVNSQILRIYRHLEEYETCKDYAEQLLSTGEEEPSYYTHLGDALCHLGKVKRGIAMLNQAVLLDAHQYEAHYLLAKLMAVMHHKNEALEHLKRAIAEIGRAHV